MIEEAPVGPGRPRRLQEAPGGPGGPQEEAGGLRRRQKEEE